MKKLDDSWRAIIKENLEVLAECTVVTSEMTTLLIKDKLITSSEKDKLMHCTSCHDKASTLYVEITRKWDNSGFQKFKTALAEGGNSRALEILNNQRILKSSNNADTQLNQVSYAAVASRRIYNDTTHSETGIESTLLTKQIASVKESLRAEFKAEVHKLKDEFNNDIRLLELKFEEFKESSSQAHALRSQEMKECRLLHKQIGFKTKSCTSSLKKSSGVCQIATFEDKSTELNGKSNSAGSREVYNTNTETSLDSEPTEPSEYQKEVCNVYASKLEFSDNQDKGSESTATGLCNVNCPWDLKGQSSFEINKVSGAWYPIEVLCRFKPWETDAKLHKYIFRPKGNTIEHIRRMVLKISNERKDQNYYYLVDQQYSHYWKNPYGAYSRMWLATDYENWGVLLWCNNKDVISSAYLHILSRDRTLSQQTLDMLRDVAEENGFPKAYGVLVDQANF